MASQTPYPLASIGVDPTLDTKPGPASYEEFRP